MIMLFEQMSSISCMQIVEGVLVSWVGELEKIHRWGPEFRWLACLEGGHNVIVSIVIAQSAHSCQTLIFLPPF